MEKPARSHDGLEGGLEIVVEYLSHRTQSQHALMTGERFSTIVVERLIERQASMRGF